MVGIGAIITQMINGLSYGAILILLAIGLSIIFGLMGVVNFAHGAFYALGAYAAAITVGNLGSANWVYPIVLLSVVVLLVVVGGTIERSVIKPLYGREPVYSLILTFGVFLLIEGLIDLLWGDDLTYSTPSFLSFRVPLGVTSYPAYRLALIVIAGLLSVGIWLFIKRTEIGAIVRAATENRDMVKALGIDIDRVYMLVFIFGSVLAGIAGMLNAPLVTLYPEMGQTILIESFVVVVVAGLNQFRGVIFAGILIGEVRAFTFFISPAATDIVIFLLMAVVLLVRPQGLLGSSGGVE